MLRVEERVSLREMGGEEESTRSLGSLQRGDLWGWIYFIGSMEGVQLYMNWICKKFLLLSN